MPDTLFQVSILLESNATEKERSQGLDLADYLLRFHHKNFFQTEKPKPEATAINKISIQSVSSLVFESLKKKYPSIDTLAKKLELEVKNTSPYSHL